MNTSTNELLQQGIEEIRKVRERIVVLSEQEAAFKSVCNALEAMLQRLEGIRSVLDNLNSDVERRRWLYLWISLGGLGLLQIIILIMLAVK